MSEDNKKSGEEIQKEYGALCAERGHLEAQVISHQRNIEGLRAMIEKNIHQTKEVIKKGEELQKKVQYDASKQEEVKEVVSVAS